MNFIQFVVPLIGGYWFLWKWNYTKFVVIEDNGYQLFFKSSIVGVIFLVLANSLVFVADFFSNGKIYNFFGAISELIPIGFDFTSILAMVMAFVSAHLLNCFFYDVSKGLTRAAEDRGKYLFLMVQEAFENSLMIEATLSSGKVYIGTPLGEMPFESEYLRMIPYFSGYRGDETKELIISNAYAGEIETIIRKNQDDDTQESLRKFRVIVPTKDIASARLFDPEVFKKLNSPASLIL